ncbi:MAG: single-stranded-DNA-specific exonuclease RecJ [Gemmatimonadales bacterium]
MRQLAPRWLVAAPPHTDRAEALAASLSLPLPLAALLVQRGYGDPEQAKAFLRPELAGLSDPLALAGMADAVATIVRAIRADHLILVHGDYDVDGQCAAALLTRGIRAAGGRAEAFVPHRMRDGYDFGSAGLAQALAIGAKLVLTCDCGITAVEAVRKARAAGLDVVVTDHHLLGPEAPPANAIVDPQRPDDTSGLGALCGTGIAFKLIQALARALGLPDSLPLHFLDYAALATVADVVPLVGENRIIVRHGLKLLARSRWAGLRALVAASGFADREIKASHVGFVLGPRLNAAGRIGDAREGLALLLSDDWDRALEQAMRLERLNTERQDIDQRILAQAIDHIEQRVDLDRTAGLVLASEQWHPGVVGIVASRVVERFGRPTFLIGLEGEVGKGSGRSISRFDLHRALNGCADLLERFGGHKMAAGLTVRRDRVDEFRERFAAICAETLDPTNLGPEQRVDLEIGLAEATDDLERLCRHLEPCGMGNPGPVFLARSAELVNWSYVGQKSEHLRGFLKDRTGGGVPAIGFQFADRVDWLGSTPVDAAFRLERHEFRGQDYLQAKLVGLAPAERTAAGPRAA